MGAYGQKFSDAYWNRVKKDLGYPNESPNLCGQGTLEKGNIVFVGLLNTFMMRYFNVSLEEDGLLFIEETKLKGEYQNGKVIFVPKSEMKKLSVYNSPGFLNLEFKWSGGKASIQFYKVGNQAENLELLETLYKENK